MSTFVLNCWGSETRNSWTNMATQCVVHWFMHPDDHGCLTGIFSTWIDGFSGYTEKSMVKSPLNSDVLPFGGGSWFPPFKWFSIDLSWGFPPFFWQTQTISYYWYVPLIMSYLTLIPHCCRVACYNWIDVDMLALPPKLSGRYHLTAERENAEKSLVQIYSLLYLIDFLHVCKYKHKYKTIFQSKYTYTDKHKYEYKSKYITSI